MEVDEGVIDASEIEDAAAYEMGAGAGAGMDEEQDGRPSFPAMSAADMEVSRHPQPPPSIVICLTRHTTPRTGTTSAAFKQPRPVVAS